MSIQVDFDEDAKISVGFDISAENLYSLYFVDKKDSTFIQLNNLGNRFLFTLRDEIMGLLHVEGTIEPFKSHHDLLNCYNCFYINQNSHCCDVLSKEVKDSKGKLCPQFELRTDGDMSLILKFIKANYKPWEMYGKGVDKMLEVKQSWQQEKQGLMKTLSKIGILEEKVENLQERNDALEKEHVKLIEEHGEFRREKMGELKTSYETLIKIGTRIREEAAKAFHKPDSELESERMHAIGYERGLAKAWSMFKSLVSAYIPQGEKMCTQILIGGKNDAKRIHD